MLLLYCVVDLIASSVGSVAGIDRRKRMFDMPSSLECNNACYGSDQMLVHNTNHRRLLSPTARLRNEAPCVFGGFGRLRTHEAGRA